MGKAECELWLPAAVRRRMVAHAEAAYPEEACGLLWMADSAEGASRWDRQAKDPQISQIAGRTGTAQSFVACGHSKSRPGDTPVQYENGLSGLSRHIYVRLAGVSVVERGAAHAHHFDDGARIVAIRLVGYTPMKNVAPRAARRRRYRLDPRALLRMERLNRRRHRILTGIFHSHPDHPAAPSRWDRQGAWPGYYYVILTVRKAVSGAMTAWQFDEGRRRFRKQSLISCENLRPMKMASPLST